MDERIHGDKTLGFSSWHADDVDCDIWLLSMRKTLLPCYEDLAVRNRSLPAKMADRIMLSKYWILLSSIRIDICQVKRRIARVRRMQYVFSLGKCQCVLNSTKFNICFIIICNNIVKTHSASVVSHFYLWHVSYTCTWNTQQQLGPMSNIIVKQKSFQIMRWQQQFNKAYLY